MRKEPLNLRIPVWMGEILDLLAFEKDLSKPDLVVDLLIRCLQEMDNTGIDKRMDR